MKTSAVGINLIKHFEGYRSEAYPDPGSSDGYPWTIGYGHTEGVHKGDKITEGTAELFLISDLASVEKAINELVLAPISLSEFDALSSFVYNLGSANFKSSTLLKKINAWDMLGAADEFPRWIYNNGNIMGGLVKRRNAERSIFLGMALEKAIADGEAAYALGWS